MHIKDESEVQVQYFNFSALAICVLLLSLAGTTGVYGSIFVLFVCKILKTLWSFKALHPQYARMGFTEEDFTHSRATPR